MKGMLNVIFKKRKIPKNATTQRNGLKTPGNSSNDSSGKMSIIRSVASLSKFSLGISPSLFLLHACAK